MLVNKALKMSHVVSFTSLGFDWLFQFKQMFVTCPPNANRPCIFLKITGMKHPLLIYSNISDTANVINSKASKQQHKHLNASVGQKNQAHKI